MSAPITSVLELQGYLDTHRDDLHPTIQTLYDTVLSGKQSITQTIVLTKADLRQIPHLAVILPFYTELTELKISESDIMAENGEVLFPAIGKMRKLTGLHLQKDCLQTCGGQKLSRVLGNLSDLRDLDLSGNNLGTEGVRHIVDSIKKLGHLQRLHLQGNGLGTGIIKHLAKELRQLKTLEVVDLEGNSFSAEDLNGPDSFKASSYRIHFNKD